MKLKPILTIILLLIGFSLQAQQDSIYKFDIDQAINYALENNINVKNKELDVKKAKWKIWETTAIGLPQVSASSEYQNFPDIPTQLMPDFLTPVVMGVNAKYFGLSPIQKPPSGDNKLPVQFGSKHNLSWGVSVSQIIFSGEYIVGLQAAKTYKLISEQNFDKAKIELKNSVEQAYYLALIARQSREILEQNFKNILNLSGKTQKMVNQGVADQTQADQIKILELNLKNQISSLKRQESLSLLMLKVQMGMAPNDSLILTSSLKQIKSGLTLEIVSENFNEKQNIDYQMMNTQVKLKTLDLRRSESKTLPSVGAYFSYSKKAMENEFNFLDSDTKWYPTAVWGIKVSIPIFGSGQKYSVIRQKKLAVMESLNQQKLISQQLNLQYEQAKSNYLNAFDNLLNQQKNKELSEKIYKDTQIKFQQGTASSMNLTQAQNQYLQAEANYYQALMQILKAKSSLEKILNQN